MQNVIRRRGDVLELERPNQSHAIRSGKWQVTIAQRELDLQLAKIKAQALLYANEQQHRQLEDIMEES